MNFPAPEHRTLFHASHAVFDWPSMEVIERTKSCSKAVLGLYACRDATFVDIMRDRSPHVYAIQMKADARLGTVEIDQFIRKVRIEYDFVDGSFVDSIAHVLDYRVELLEHYDFIQLEEINGKCFEVIIINFDAIASFLKVEV